jgi:hypothetical protein
MGARPHVQRARLDDIAACQEGPGPQADTSAARPEQVCLTGSLFTIYLLQDIPNLSFQDRHIKLCGLPDLSEINSKVLMHENVS